jgi:hypothetical protein
MQGNLTMFMTLLTNLLAQSEWLTLVLGAKRAISAAAAFPALFSSIKLIVELIISRQTIPTKSCQSGPSP